MRYRYYFIEAMILTIFLFTIGFLVGLNIEQNRNNQLSEYYRYTQEEIDGLSEHLDISNLGKYTCSELIERNNAIGNEIYQQALIFQNYEESAIFTKQELVTQHKKFDELRTNFWINSINIKERCGSRVFTTVVYLYDYPAETNEEAGIQRVMEMITGEIKRIYGDRVILIPIAKNLNIISLEELIYDSDLEGESAAIIVNEKEVFFSNDVSEIRDFFNTNTI